MTPVDTLSLYFCMVHAKLICPSMSMSFKLKRYVTPAMCYKGTRFSHEQQKYTANTQNITCT
jgi:hypothetical protein